MASKIPVRMLCDNTDGSQVHMNSEVKMQNLKQNFQIQII